MWKKWVLNHHFPGIFTAWSWLIWNMFFMHIWNVFLTRIDMFQADWTPRLPLVNRISFRFWSYRSYPDFAVARPPRRFFLRHRLCWSHGFRVLFFHWHGARIWRVNLIFELERINKVYKHAQIDNVKFSTDKAIIKHMRKGTTWNNHFCHRHLFWTRQLSLLWALDPCSSTASQRPNEKWGAGVPLF